MNKTTVTLQDVFTLPNDDLDDRQRSDLDQQDCMKGLRQKLAEEVREIEWPVASSEIIHRIRDVLDISLPDLMVAAWNKGGQIRAYLDRSKAEPDETLLLPLVEHTIKSTHQPYLDVLFNDRSLGKIRLDITVSLKLTGVTLSIRNQKIKSIAVGRCHAKGEIKLEKMLLVEQESKPISLPGRINLGTGIAIPV